MKNYPRFRYLMSVYATGILLFTLFRLINTGVYLHQLDEPAHWGMNFFKAMWMGFRFDTVVSGYILSLPLLCLFTASLCRIRRRGIYLSAHILVTTLYCVAFFACAADIPYFNYFFTRLNVAALAWMDSLSFVVKMIVEEPRFLFFLFLFLLLATGYIIFMCRLYRKYLKFPSTEGKLLPQILVGCCCIAACLLGMRGRISIKSPIRVGTAYFCNNAFLNQLGLNPVFTFLNSAKEIRKNKKIQLIDGEIAEKIYLQQLQSFTPTGSDLIQLPANTNVVVVIMESMAAHKVGHYNPESQLTPCLDSIAAQALCYRNAYSAGIHTYNGIYSTLFSYPAIPGQHSMKKTVIPTLCGLPHHLKAHGYQTFYFTTHDEQFDNVAGFLYANDMEKVISQKDYPAKEVKSTLGIPDHVLFKHVVGTLDQCDTLHPFFAWVMTASDHNPYVLPDDIGWQPQSKEMAQTMVEYADWSIGSFMRQAQNSSWFNHTLFVFVADHGAAGNSIYDMSLNYHHLPLLFYAPSQIPAQEREELALQIDIGPTIIGMLFPEEGNNSFGIDLQRQQRKYAYFSADNKIGVLDGQHFYRYRMDDGKESLYRYREQDEQDYISAEKSKADSMRIYGFSMIQEAYLRLKSGNTTCK